MDGMAVITTEGIGSKATGYHPVQERIAGCNGAQCGFCTPGQVMALYSFLRDKGTESISAEEIESRFDGNICRCTGYRPIVTAATSFATDGTNSKFSENIAGMPAKDFAAYDPTTEPAGPDLTTLGTEPLLLEGSDGTKWYKVTSLDQIEEVCALRNSSKSRFVFGGTMAGVYASDLDSDVFIDISAVPELHGITSSETGLTVGAATSIADLSLALKGTGSPSHMALHQHIQKIASWNVRNAGSWAGNLVMARTKNFASDMATIFMGAGATLNLLANGTETSMGIEDFLWLPDLGENYVILSVQIPSNGTNEHLFTFRQAMRSVNAHAVLNAAFRATLEGTVISACSLVLGCAKEHAFLP